jgi:hypothetical protein
MTRLTQVNPVTVLRALLLCAPVLALGACAAPPPPPPESSAAQALEAAQHAQATADQALAAAQRAESEAASSRTASSEMYNRSLRK